MKKKIIILSVFLAAMVLISGCIDDKKSENPVNGTETIKSDQIPTANLPPGITFMAVHEAEVTLRNFSREAIEGVYRSDGNEIYVQVFSTETPDALIDEYKSQYKDYNYDPFTEISINGHNATQVTDYTFNGTQIPKYNIIWTTKNSMIMVDGSVDAQKAIELAKATNS